MRCTGILVVPLESSSAPSWFHHPKAFLRVVEQNLVDLRPWYLMDHDQVVTRMQGLRLRYPGRELVPFARRDDNDDVACWEKDRGEAVVVIHDFASAGHEERRVLPDFWSWFRGAVEDMIEFEP